MPKGKIKIFKEFFLNVKKIYAAKFERCIS